MSLDGGDLIDGMLNEQARVNAAVDAGDVNDLVADYQQVTGEAIGLVETVSTQYMGGNPHTVGDGQTWVGYFQTAAAGMISDRFMMLRYGLVVRNLRDVSMRFRCS